MEEEYTRFERARIIGARALQIARGAPLFIDADVKDPLEIAKVEFEKGLIPLCVRKKNPPRMDVVEEK